MSRTTCLAALFMYSCEDSVSILFDFNCTVGLSVRSVCVVAAVMPTELQLHWPNAKRRQSYITSRQKQTVLNVMVGQMYRAVVLL